MRAVLVTLSGDPELARAALKTSFPTAEIVSYPRAALETGNMGARLGALRKERPDVFAVMTESLSWQYGREALMLFGALAGARKSVVLDARGGALSRTRMGLLARSPLRIARNLSRGALGVRRASQTLDRLERAAAAAKPLKNDLPYTDSGASIVYLRATPAPGTQPGGATSHINGVVKALLGLGSKITFISNDEIAGLDKDKVLFHKIAPNADIMPRSAFDIVNGMAFSAESSNIISASKPDFIYQRYSRFSVAGVEASLLFGMPLFLEYNGSEVWIGKHWDKTEQIDLLERCERLNLKAASRVLVISEVERNNLLSAGVPDEKIVVNPNGVDTDEFCPDLGGHRVREELGVPPNATLVGFVGTFGPWHGVLTLADAITLVPKNANIWFLLVGDGSLRAEVENRLHDSGDSDRVIFAGTVSHDRVPTMLDACDILVSPHVPLADGSDFFGSPTKLFEYMAMGKGIVASQLGQIGDVLVDGETALLVEPGNPRELGDAILELTNDPALLRRLGQTARKAAIAKHTWRHNAARVLEIYKRDFEC